MSAKHKTKKTKPAADPARLMRRDQFTAVLGKLEQLAQTKNTAVVDRGAAEGYEGGPDR